VEMTAIEQAEGCPLTAPYFRLCRTRDDSKRLNDEKGPAVIISASGMATGGRVQHHLLHRLGDPRATVLFVGYQAEGTVGRQLLEGAASVHLLGNDVRVKAHVAQIPALSAHADSDELMAWMKTAPKAPNTVFLTHGEPAALDALKERIERELHWNVKVPNLDDVAEL
jgi:metallo-beta-lactamase family protein